MTARDTLKILLRSGSGRAGAVFLLVMVLVSAYVLVSFPLDFGSRQWNNPAEWADNPRAVPPAWVSFFGNDDAVPHVAFTASEPTDVVAAGSARRLFYAFDYEATGETAPSFISFTVSDVRFQSRPPVLSVEVTRPDGKRVTLYREVVRGPRPGEEAPYTRYREVPLRVFISGSQDTLTSLSSFLRREFDVSVTPNDLGGRVEQVIFGIPVAGQPGVYQPLSGKYTFTVQALVTDPADTIGGVKLVLGGTVFGVMGTDALGRDLAVGLLFGFPVALTIGLVTSLLSTTIGTFMGILSGFMGGKIDIIIQRFSDIWSNIPLLPILIFLIFILGQRLWLVVVILVLFGWPGLAIVVRSMVLQIRSGQLVEATQALGASRKRIMFRHILFQIAPFVFAQMIFFTPAAILAEAGLSFLGLGDPSIPTWGQILESGFRTGAVYLGYWWWVMPPGLLIVFTAMTFVLLTLGLEPVINPRLRSSS